MIEQGIRHGLWRSRLYLYRGTRRNCLNTSEGPDIRLAIWGSESLMQGWPTSGGVYKVQGLGGMLDTEA